MQIISSQNPPAAGPISPQQVPVVDRFHAAEPARQITANRPGSYADGKTARARPAKTDAGKSGAGRDDQTQGDAPGGLTSQRPYRGQLLDLSA
jgi:hypothetical protein